MSDEERRVVARVHDERHELIGLVGELVSCDTTSRDFGDPPRDEMRLQEILASRLRSIGAEVELFEPDPMAPGEVPWIPYRLDFDGRPQLVAVLKGTGGGRALVLNGHIDAVSPGDVSRWTSHPFRPEVRDGFLYGRGASDMKSGLASFLFALECLHREGVRLRGDVVFCTNTDEESTGAGGIALVRHGVSGDAGLCGEPTGFDAWVACRGGFIMNIIIPGRTGHAEMPPPHWREGGAVNAIERLELVLGCIRRLREEWRQRPDSRHPLLSPPDFVPVIVKGGEWWVTYPERVQLTCDVQYLPARVGECGYGQPVRDEVMASLNAVAASDPWLAEHPLRFDFLTEAVPAEIPADHPLVQLALDAAAQLGHDGQVSGFDSWHDAATFTAAGIPMFSFGPSGLETAHRVDERVGVQDVVDHCAATALTIARFCGL